ncbi:hypothetical protein U9M48_043519 [Paspalum notatum var. saurae]|uniref:Uncharacterized protein n=1 Tax=Paspalum notatum var. saurae TaxID=547442 RepID=A0AAQ3XHG1_PASNO
MIVYMVSYLQDITARLGSDVNLPPFCPHQMSQQQGSTGWVPPPQGLQPPPGWTMVPQASQSPLGVDDGTLGLPDTSEVDGTAGLGAISWVDGTTGFSASSGLDGTARLPATFGVGATLGLNATFGVDASCCTTLQPMDAITSSALWITGC